MFERSYHSHLSLEAATFVISLSKRRQKSVLDLADQIARYPFQISDHQTLDTEGRVMENLTVDRYHFTYWVDHASCEVRITEIIAV